MSQVFILLIRAYQFLVSPMLHTAFGPTAGCRYEFSCSEYTIRALQRLGLIRGGAEGIRRIFSCHP